MSWPIPFTPILGATKTMSATDTSSSTSGLSTKGKSLLLTNLGTNKVFIRYGNGAQTAVATTDMPLLAGQSIVVSRGDGTAGDDTVAAICAATETATLYVTPGFGV